MHGHIIYDCIVAHLWRRSKLTYHQCNISHTHTAHGWWLGQCNIYCPVVLLTTILQAAGLVVKLRQHYSCTAVGWLQTTSARARLQCTTLFSPLEIEFLDKTANGQTNCPQVCVVYIMSTQWIHMHCYSMHLSGCLHMYRALQVTCQLK